MRAVVQRVSEASVRVEGELIGRIRRGLLVLAGAAKGDGAGDSQAMATKIAQLRVFEDENGKMNRSVEDVGGAVLVVSQFTLLGDVRKGRRPSFGDALEPQAAELLVAQLVTALRARGIHVEEGRFGATMDVALINQGPVTILIDSQRRF